jgi:hypothetical protein
VGHVSHMNEINAYKILVRKCEGSLGRLKRNWKKSIKTVIIEIEGFYSLQIIK